MSGPAVIKAGTAGRADQALPLREQARQPDPRDEQLTLLRRENAELASLLDDSRKAAAEAVAKARAEGLAEGRSKAAKDDAARSAQLRAACQAALHAWKDRLQSLDALAAALACEAVEKIFGDAPDEQGLVAKALSRQLALLGREAVLSVHVSASDFDETAVDALAAMDGAAGAAIFRNAGLRPGDCRIDLKLGHVDVGPRTQWQALRAQLEAMAAGERTS